VYKENPDELDLRKLLGEFFKMGQGQINLSEARWHTSWHIYGQETDALNSLGNAIIGQFEFYDSEDKTFIGKFISIYERKKTVLKVIK